MSRRRRIPDSRGALALTASALALGALVAAGARAEGVDWSAIGAAETVEILTRDADDDPRITKTWIVVLDGVGYVRSASRGLLANLARDPAARLRVEDREIPVSAAVDDDPALAERVEAAHRVKYPDCPLCRLFQLRTPRVVELTARP